MKAAGRIAVNADTDFRIQVGRVVAVGEIHGHLHKEEKYARGEIWFPGKPAKPSIQVRGSQQRTGTPPA
ncbi:MAG: hypothetical protein BroJett014_09700 [Planctomycetota bacterium]|nr:MAG: hypothetical protein BroJett014_09700 [Planctomycetota bacterium]